MNKEKGGLERSRKTDTRLASGKSSFKRTGKRSVCFFPSMVRTCVRAGGNTFVYLFIEKNTIEAVTYSMFSKRVEEKHTYRGTCLDGGDFAYLELLETVDISYFKT